MANPFTVVELLPRLKVALLAAIVIDPFWLMSPVFRMKLTYSLISMFPEPQPLVAVSRLTLSISDEEVPPVKSQFPENVERSPPKTRARPEPWLVLNTETSPLPVIDPLRLKVCE